MEIYKKIRAATTKAKLGYLLSLCATEIDSSITPEQLLYECLYILDILSSEKTNNPISISSLGYLALVKYGDVTQHSKYLYAIESFESALLNYEIRHRNNI